MKKYISYFAMLLFIASFSAFSEEEGEPKPPPPLNPKYMGKHGMKLLNKGSSVFASYMFKLEEPHNVQILYKLSINSVALLRLIKDAELVTIKTEEFNLERLIRGDEVEISADVYMGHYKEGGMKTYSDLKIMFKKQLLAAKIDEPKPSNKRQEYHVIPLPNNERLLVHKIQTPPTYEHLIYLSDDVNCITDFTASSAVPTQNEIHYKLTYCGSLKPLYYNRESFQ